MINDKVDIILISARKIDNTFPTSEFLMNGYCNVYRLDQNDKGGGTMPFVKNKFITFPASGFCFSEKTNILHIIKPQETKYGWYCCYNPHKHVLKDCKSKKQLILF